MHCVYFLVGTLKPAIMFCRTMYPVQSTDPGSDDYEAYQHLNHAIENGEALNEVFSNLSIE